jgi:octaheme c-type cytochrome (tetrathionate reductase family)
MGPSRRLCYLLLLIGTLLPAPWYSTAWASPSEEDSIAPGRALAQQAISARAAWSTSDHSKHPALQKTFTSGAQITAACLSCHSEAEEQFKKTIHWKWIGYTDETSKKLGKAGDSVNNFCISTNNMQDKSCNACHPGWQGKEAGVNCLSCHGSKKINWSEAFEDYNAFAASDDPEETDLALEIQTDILDAVQAIGLPTRSNCGECHFKGGGGDGVKHGDLDTSLIKPGKALDVHMGVDGQNFNCTRCHTTVRHHVAGRIYSKPAFEQRTSLLQDDLTPKITCESCHGDKPHAPGDKVNDHTDKVACQSCHIPTFARELPTKMSWDWSRAGRLREGQKYKEEGPLGRETYLSIKGVMHWEKNVQPEYAWFNGVLKTLTVKDRIDPSSVVAVSAPVGDPQDPNARIFPFKVHRGKQPYDKVNKTLLAPLLSGAQGYWTTLDWDEALTQGMRAMDVPFSGEFDFAATSYVLPTTHMVAPKENALACTQCHVRDGSRLVGIPGVFMPGRDRNPLVDTFGWLAVMGALAGVFLHGAGRMFSNGRKHE